MTKNCVATSWAIKRSRFFEKVEWSQTLSSNLSYAFTDLEDLGDGNRAPDAIRSGGVGHINLIWVPVEKFTTGIEFMWGRRENEDGAKGTATRLQTMFKFDF